jgi:Rad3-related DNA helicase
VTARVALETFSIMRERGLRLRSIQLTAKDRICPMETRACNPDACPRARGHFDRVNEALYALVTEQEDVSRRVLEEYAEKYNVCPFELGLDVSLFADAVVGDYNYLFDPHARLKRFFAEGKAKNRYLFLVDEAHNLVERGREMYSASLSSGEIRAFRSSVREVYPALWRKLGKLVAAFRPCREQLGGEDKAVFPEDIDAFADAAYKVMEEMQSILYEQRRSGQADHSPGLPVAHADHSSGLPVAPLQAPTAGQACGRKRLAYSNKIPFIQTRC